jgi:hypothetical protein
MIMNAGMTTIAAPDPVAALSHFAASITDFAEPP